MATTMHWLPGWPAAGLRSRAARARAIPDKSDLPLARGERVLLAADRVVATDRALYRVAASSAVPSASADSSAAAGASRSSAFAVDGGRVDGGQVDRGSADGGDQAAGEWVRFGWEQVVRADPHERGIVVTAWAPGLPSRTVISVSRAARLLALARERIAWTILLTTRVPVAGHPTQVTARRQPGPGTLVWMVALAPEVTPTPAVEAELVAALRRLRREFPHPLP